MANEVGPAPGKPTTMMTCEAVSTIGSPVRGFHHGPEPKSAPEQRPQIRLQSVLLANTHTHSKQRPAPQERYELTTTFSS
jgi:hypothetical protein